MSKPNPLTEAIELTSVTAIAVACAVSHQAVRKWEKAGRLPASEHAGKTRYAARIAHATGRRIKVAAIRNWSLAGWEKAA